MDEHLSDSGAPDVCILNLLWCHVFTLCQFEYVLLSVDDFQGALLKEPEPMI